jgi:hypothetical protein
LSQVLYSGLSCLGRRRCLDYSVSETTHSCVLMSTRQTSLSSGVVPRSCCCCSMICATSKPKSVTTRKPRPASNGLPRTMAISLGGGCVGAGCGCVAVDCLLRNEASAAKLLARKLLTTVAPPAKILCEGMWMAEDKPREKLCSAMRRAIFRALVTSATTLNWISTPP